MLHDISIENLGVIAHATAEFNSGLTVVTGETGAGKTMVVSSLKLLSGQRADASRVRSGQDKAIVEGVFSTSDSRVHQQVEEVGGYVDGEEVIISRTVHATGRSRAHLAGKTVAAGVLNEVSGHLITIHGQNDQLRLLDPTKQLHALDRYAQLEQLREEFQGLRAEWLASEKELREKTAAKRDLALEAEVLQQSIALINEVDPHPGEDDELKQQIQRLQAADDLRAALGAALVAIEGDEADAMSSGAIGLVGGAESSLQVDDPQLRELAERLGELNSQLSDVAREIGQAFLDVPDPAELEQMLERQQELRQLRKFAADVDGAIAWREEAEARLAAVDVSDEALQALQERVEAQQAAMRECGIQLGRKRRTAADKFAAEVTQEIKALQMSAAVAVELREVEPNPDGLDECEFQLVQGEHRTALATSASGGELSRVMLALEVILAGSGRTLVFDEVDAGVGGKAAVEIGRRLARLALDNQVIVVTHLPQVAAFADSHIYVAKSVTETAVASRVRSLVGEERVAELARMLAGLESDTGRAHAEELLAMATNAKNALQGH